MVAAIRRRLMKGTNGSNWTVVDWLIIVAIMSVPIGLQVWFVMVVY